MLAKLPGAAPARAEDGPAPEAPADDDGEAELSEDELAERLAAEIQALSGE